MKKICVIGSINMDFMALSNVNPKAGETVLGESFYKTFGGKGANQAIAAARLGGDVSFIGVLGKDDIGDDQLSNFKKNNINTQGVVQVEEQSGVAQILNVNGENSIVVIAGANNLLTDCVIDRSIKLIEQSDIILVQNEIPLESVKHIINICSNLNKTIIYNPAPFKSIERSYLNKVTYLTPNEIELEQLFHSDIKSTLTENQNVLVTLGNKGVSYYDNGIQKIKARKVDPIDTTGAGDTFNGAFAYALANEFALNDAIQFANNVASIAITKIGAQSAMPTMKEYLEIIE